MKTTTQSIAYKSQWHAVGAVGGASACNAVLLIRGKRFLPAEAPRFPLPECSTPSRCQCTYRHFADRRAAPRAPALHRIPASGDRRQGRRGRRADDWNHRPRITRTCAFV